MYDIHCHVLPAVDDGAKDIEDSISICKSAALEGVKQIIATPHFIESDSEIEKKIVLEKIDKLNLESRQNNIDVTVYPGMEVFITNNLVHLYKQDKLLTLNNSKYLLIEFPLYNSLPNYIESTMFDLQLNGITPIIAHPERCRAIIDHPNIVCRLIEKGCLMQTNSGSIQGYFGKSIQKTALLLIEHKMVHFAASDNHSSRGRMIKLKSGYDIVSEKFGQSIADMLYIDNPGCIFSGQDIYVDDPVKIVKKKFLFFK